MALEMRQFIETSKPNHLTLGDIKQLSPGDSLDVVIWDRNFEEGWIWSAAEENHPYDPTFFFRENRHKLVMKGNLIWDIHYSWGQVVRHPIEFDVSDMNTKWTWAPVKNGVIQIDNAFLDGDSQWAVNSRKIHNKSQDEFPDSTRVGWRGPIMLWDKLSNYPNVYVIPLE